MFDNVSYKYDEKTQVYTFSSNFGINFRGFIMNSIVGRKKFDLLFRNLSFKEIVIDSFFLLELNEICKYILNGEAPYTSWVNLKAIKALQKVLMEETWLNPKEYDFHGAFKLNMDLLDKVMDVKPLGFQEKAYVEYEFFKNVLGYNGILLDAGTGVGKDQPLDSLIRIPNGWKRMGDIELGDEVIAADGTITKVNGVFPQGEKDVYRITFKDGRTAECGLHHLWKIHRSVRNGKTSSKVITTEELIEFIGLKTPSQVRYYIQLVKPEQNKDKDFIIPPYVMGIFLGDGCFSQKLTAPQYTISCNQVIENMKSKLDMSKYKFRTIHAWSEDHKYSTISITQKENRGLNIYTKEFDRLELRGKRSYEKFIPKDYLNGSEEQRWELLRGLMDTDGTINTNNSISYSTSSKQLADDFRELVWSLGGVASIGRKMPTYMHNGHKRIGKVSYNITIQMHEPKKIFSRPSRADRTTETNQYTKHLRLRINKVEYIGKKETQCISIEHPEHLYVTDNYIVTHNTHISLSLSIALESEIVVMVVMNVSIDATWKKALLRENFFNKDYQPTESDIYTSADYYNGKPYTGQKYVIFNYEAINKLNLFIGKFKYRKITVIVDEVHNFTADSKRKNDLLELAIQTKSKDIILLSGTPVKSSTLELIPYLELIDPKFTPVVKNRFQKIYGSPNNILKRCTPIRYGMMSTRIEKAELNLEPVEYKTITVTLPDGDLYTLKHIKEEMIKYIDVRSKEIEDNLWKYKNVYAQLLEKVKFGSNLPAMTWIEYQNDFELVCEYYVKRQLMFHGELIKRVNDFEKTIIIASLQGDEKKQFKEAAVILKYPMLKIRGEVLGIIVLGNRIKCHKEMAKVLDYSILDSTVAKGIVMTSYVEIADAVVEKLKKQKYIPATIYGDNTKQSAKTISEFIDNEAINPLVGTYKSISTGLHLVVANMIILLDLPFRTYMLDQAIARVHRMGQERQVIVLYTVLDTGEEYNINSRNIDILKWSKEAIEEITGHMVKGLDFEKGKALDLGIDDESGLENEYPYWVWADGLESGYMPDTNNYSIYYPWSGLENDSSMKDIYIDIKNLYKEPEANKLYTW